MRKVTVAIERIETITIELDIPEEHSRSSILAKISEDPGVYLENHLDNVIRDNTDFKVASMHFKED